MKRLLLFVLCFLSLSGLHAKDIPDMGNNHLVKVSSQQNEQDNSDTSDDESKLTLLVNMANNSLTSWNNQITLQSIILTILSIILTGVGIFGASRIKRLERRYKQFERNEESQRQKNQVMEYYIRRLNEFLFKTSFDLMNSNSTASENNAQDETMKNAYIGYQLISLSVKNISNEYLESVEKEKAMNEIQQALDQIVKKGGPDDLIVLQEMAEVEISKEKKKLLKKAAKELQDRLLEK